MAGLDDSEAPEMLGLARKLLGASSVISLPSRALPGPAALVSVRGQRRIYLRKGLNPKVLRWALAHELAHWALRIDSSTIENEDACDALAACLVAPRSAYLRALRSIGQSYTKLASAFATSESCAALRLGEVTGTSLVLVTTKRVRYRGAEFGWPQEIRDRIPGMRRTTLQDDRSRIVLAVA